MGMDALVQALLMPKELPKAADPEVFNRSFNRNLRELLGILEPHDARAAQLAAFMSTCLPESPEPAAQIRELSKDIMDPGVMLDISKGLLDGQAATLDRVLSVLLGPSDSTTLVPPNTMQRVCDHLFVMLLLLNPEVEEGPMQVVSGVLGCLAECMDQGLHAASEVPALLRELLPILTDPMQLMGIMQAFMGGNPQMAMTAITGRMPHLAAFATTSDPIRVRLRDAIVSSVMQGQGQNLFG